MDPLMIPIYGTVLGSAMVVVIVFLVFNHKVEEMRMRVETEIQQMEMAYQRARQSLGK